MSLLPNPLTDTGENPAAGDTTPSPADLEAQARTPATTAWVERRLNDHNATCGATRRMRVWSLWVAFGLGAVVIFNLIALAAGRAVIRETVRAVVREELDIRGLKARVAVAPPKPGSLFIPYASASDSISP